MKILLDTCTFLWIVAGDPALGANAREAFRDPANEVYLSAVSAWEMAVKHALGRLPLPESPDTLVPRLRQDHRIETLPLDEASALHLARLPALHRDPFDRMLICQAVIHGMAILTPDEAIAQYGVRVHWMS